MTSPLAWGKKVSQEFRDILYEGCAAMQWSLSGPSNLMACMAFESDETFSPSIKSPVSSATGLIQFMDATALSLGTTTAHLASMSAEEQLHWVFKYFDQFDRLKSPNTRLSDIYMAILMPKYIGYAEDTIIIVDPKQYRVNSGLDTNKDARITKREAAAKVEEKLEKGFGAKYCFP